MEPDDGAVGVLQADVPDELTELFDLMKQTPDYEIATTQIESTKEGMRVTRSDRFPQVSFNASAGLSGEDHPEYGDWNVGLRASMPLFTGNRLRSEVAAAKERLATLKVVSGAKASMLREGSEANVGMLRAGKNPDVTELGKVAKRAGQPGASSRTRTWSTTTEPG